MGIFFRFILNSTFTQKEGIDKGKGGREWRERGREIGKDRERKIEKGRER